MKAYALPRHPRDIAAAATASSPHSNNTTTSTNRSQATRTKQQQQPQQQAKIQLSMSESSENAVAASSPRSRTTPISVTSSSSASKSKVSYTKGSSRSSRIPTGSSKLIKGKGKSKSRTRKWGSSSLASNAAPQLTEEQMTFENKLCLDEQGLIINKIDRHGKAQLRYVRCMSLVAWNKTKKRNFASRSTGALNGRHAHYFNGSRSTGDFYTNTLDDTQNLLHTNPLPAAPVRNSATGKMNPSEYVLVWGKHPSHCIPLDRFQCITLGRQTVRTKLSRASHTCLLSLCTTAKQQVPSQSSQQQQQSSFDDGSSSSRKQEHASVLDIQAPTKMDRDLFANAFAQFLGINIITFEVEWDAEQQSVASPIPAITTGGSSTSNSKPSPEAVSSSATRDLNHQKNNKSVILKKKMDTRTRQNNHNKNMNKTAVTSASSSHTNPTPPTTTTLTTTKSIPISTDYKETESVHMIKTDAVVVATNSMSAQRPPPLTDNENNRILSDDDDVDDLSAVSSLTNHVDGEIVEELHCIIIGLKNELNAARAEANRAVKVAEQAIQSAESVHDSNNNHGGAGGSGGSDWNATVTHQAAKAAALAQKKSAAALSRARQAEESLAREQAVKLQLEKQSQVLQHRLRGLQAQLHFSSRSLSTTSFKNTNDRTFHEERCWRRKLLSNVLDTRGTARTYCALFPLPPSPPPSSSFNASAKSKAQSKGDGEYTEEIRILQRVSPTAIYIEEESDSKSTNSGTGDDHDKEEVSNAAAGRYFNFDAVIGNDMEEVYEESVHPLLMDASSEGYSCVYFTVDACTSVNSHKNTLHPLSSLIKASMDTLLFSNNNRNENVDNGHWTVHMSILEVFNERLYDLLDGDNDAVSDQKQRKTKRLEMKTNNSGDVSLWNLARMELRTRSEVESCLLSLRSNFRGGHVVVSITIQRNKCTVANDALYAVGKMTFVHLARDRHPLTTKMTGLKHVNANAVKNGGDHQQQSQLQLLNKSFVNLKHIIKLHADRRLRYDIDSEHADVFQNSSNAHRSNNRPSCSGSRSNQNIDMINHRSSSFSKAAAGKNDSKSVPYRNATLTHLLKDVLHCGTEAMSTYCPEDYQKRLPSSGYFLETDSANSLGYLSSSRPHAKVAVLLLAHTRYEMPIKRIMDGVEKDESEGRAPFTSGKELENILDFVDDFGRLSTKYLV